MRYYTVCILFDPSGENLLMVRKNRTTYSGKLNGIGGETEFNESATKCAVREIYEEAGISLQESDLIWLVTMELPFDCKKYPNEPDEGCALFFFASKLTKEQMNHIKTENDVGEDIVVIPTSEVLNATANDPRFAGEGDIPYVVNLARNRFQFD